MIKLLSHLFIKNKDDVSSLSVRSAYGTLCGCVGISLNIMLFIAKYIAGTITASIAITADAFNNLSDAGSSFVTLMGFKLAAKKADRDHPFGHGRLEYISGLIVSGAIIVMGFELGRDSFSKLLHPAGIETSTVAVIILCASIAVKLYMVWYNTHYGKLINSAAMKATAKDSLSDVVSTSVVLASTLIYRFAGLNIDAWCGLAVAVFILYSGCSAAKDTIGPLLGNAPDPQFVENVEKIVLKQKDVIGIHDMLVHDYGPGRVMVSLHAEVPGNKDIFYLHDEIDNAEMQLEKQLHCIATIHMDPICVDDEKVVYARAKVAEIVSSIDPQLSIHDFRMVTGETHTNLIFDLVVPPSYEKTAKVLSEQVRKKIHEVNKSYYAVIKVEQSYI
jgi:cation diffusion facilitator family transporter